MAAPLPIAYFDGRFMPIGEVRVSPLDRGFLFADSVYEVLPAYGGRPFRFVEHVDRLNRSCREIRLAPVEAEIEAQLLGDIATFVGAAGDAVEHDHGVSPQWPIKYQELEKYYAAAERLFRVYGCQTDDAAAPFRSADYPYAPPSSSDGMLKLVKRLRERGVSPFPQSLCLNRESVAAGGCDLRGRSSSSTTGSTDSSKHSLIQSKLS